MTLFCISVSITAGIIILIPITKWLQKYLQGGQYTKPTKIYNKIVLITGGNTGIGKETALDLAGRGAKVYLGCRDHERGEAARLNIIEKTGNKNVFNRKLDLSSITSIRKFAEEFKKEENNLDIIINNAGYGGPKQYTEEGFDMAMGVNHLGHFLLTNLLLDNLKISSPSRIVVVSSLVHAYGEINRTDFNTEKSKGYTDYNHSKLANVLFTRSLAKKLEGTGVTVNALHPGVVDTEIMRHVPKKFYPILIFFKTLFFKTAKSGAQTTIRLAVDPELEKVTGKYFSDCKEKECADRAKDEDTAEWLWNKSETVTGCKY